MYSTIQKSFSGGFFLIGCRCIVLYNTYILYIYVGCLLGFCYSCLTRHLCDFFLAGVGFGRDFKNGKLLNHAIFYLIITHLTESYPAPPGKGMIR